MEAGWGDGGIEPKRGKEERKNSWTRTTVWRLLAGGTGGKRGDKC